MSFVSRIVELSGAVFMDKPFHKYNIKELDALLKPYEYREELFYPKEILTKENELRSIPQLAK